MTPSRTRTGWSRARQAGPATALVVASAMLLGLAAPGHARGGGGGSVRAANFAASRPMTAPAPRAQMVSPGAGSYAGTQARTNASQAYGTRSAYNPGGARGTYGSAQAYGARGAYGNGAASVAAARNPGVAAVAGGGYRGPAWATQLPAGARAGNYFGRPYYNYGRNYYRPYLYGGVPYYGYVWPPYYAYYDEAPTGSIAIDNGGSQVFYSDGTYYETTNDGGDTRYQVVPAPSGASLPPGTLPQTVATVTVGGATYGFWGNTFYRMDAQGPVVSGEPAGLVTLADLPADFEPVPVGNLTYFRSGGGYYLSYLAPGGAELYVQVDPPSGGAAAPAPGAGAAPAMAPPPPPARTVTLMLRAGTVATVRLGGALNSGGARPGDSFECVLADDLQSDGRLVAAKGARAYGKVESATADGPAGSATLVLRLTDLTIGDRVVQASTEAVRFGAGGSAPQGGAGADLGANLGAALGAEQAAAAGGDRVILHAGTAVSFRLTSTLLVGVAE